MFLKRIRPKVYVRLTPSWLWVRDIAASKTVCGVPLLAIESGGRKKLLAVGEEVAALMHETGVSVLNPFTHPRTLISDMTAAEAVLNGFVKKLLADVPKLRQRPLLILHPCIEPEGGFTQVEVRALLELARSTGCPAKLWRGRELTDEQVRSGNFPTDGRLVG